MSEAPYQFTVAGDEPKQRLDAYLAKHMPNMSRSQLKRLIDEGHVQLNGRTVASASTKIKCDDAISLQIPAPEPSHIMPQTMELDIIFEDEDVLVVNKPAGLTVHPAAGNPDNTLVNGLLAHCGDELSGIGGVIRPGIVHRIDKDTSGLLVVAKHDKAHQHLSEQLKSRTLKRVYDALVWGVPMPAEGSIEGAIGRNPRDRKKMAIVAQGKEARTHYWTEDAYYAPTKKAGNQPFAAHLRCELDTGRTHQIRVHCAELGHDLIGDPLYGRNSSKKLAPFALSEETEGFLNTLYRQMLHARILRFNHPVKDVPIECEAPWPDDMLKCKELLQKI